MRAIFVGDVALNSTEPENAFALVEDVFADADFIFGNCEAVYSGTHDGTARARHYVAPPENIRGLVHAGFSAMSCANNITMLGGQEALLTTLANLKSAGIAPVGAGPTIEIARQPVIVAASGVTLGVVACTVEVPFSRAASSASHVALGVGDISMQIANTWSVPFLPEATEDTPGVALIRQQWAIRQPGHDELMPTINTVPTDDDLEAFKSSILAARKAADTVIVSLHLHHGTTPPKVTTFERAIARLAIDFGADAVVAHSHHSLRGCEWYEGKPIFYGLGNFVMHAGFSDASHVVRPLPEVDDEEPDTAWGIALPKDAYVGVARRKRWPLNPYPPESRMTMVAWVEVAKDGVVQAVGMVPCVQTPQGQVAPLGASDPEGARVVEYLRWLCQSQAFNANVLDSHDYAIGGLDAVEIVPRNPSDTAASVTIG